jgi:hypothetical protein
MKTIVIAGAHSGVGKTRLARDLCGLLPGARHVKIGHGREKKGEGNVFYPMGTPFSRIARDNGRAGFLVIESNRILAEMRPDCTIYLSGGAPKPSAEGIEKIADIVRGRCIDNATIERLGRALGLNEETVLEIIELAGAGPDTGRRGKMIRRGSAPRDMTRDKGRGMK